MIFPWHDWQFWVVTVACLGGLWGIVSPLLPRKGRPADACARQQALERLGGGPPEPGTGPLVVLDERR